MKIGTKSILFGAHQFLLHPWFVAAAWWRLYGFPWDLRLWVAFFVHDLGYWGKPNMDGLEGEEHVLLGANILSDLFDAVTEPDGKRETCPYHFGTQNIRWFSFAQFHSRFWAKRNNRDVSKLGVADKLSIALTPAWLYLPAVRATGEIREYMALVKARTSAGEPKYASMQLATNDEARWYADVQEYLRRWVEEHKDGKKDIWTPKL